MTWFQSLAGLEKGAEGEIKTETRNFFARCGNTCMQSLCWEVDPQGLLEHTGHPIAEPANTRFVRDSVAKNKKVGPERWFSHQDSGSQSVGCISNTLHS